MSRSYNTARSLRCVTVLLYTPISIVFWIEFFGWKNEGKPICLGHLCSQTLLRWSTSTSIFLWSGKNLFLNIYHRARAKQWDKNSKVILTTTAQVFLEILWTILPTVFSETAISSIFEPFRLLLLFICLVKVFFLYLHLSIADTVFYFYIKYIFTTNKLKIHILILKITKKLNWTLKVWKSSDLQQICN